MKYFLEVTIPQLPASDCSYEQATDRGSSGSYPKLYNMNMYLSNYLLLCLPDQLCFHKVYHPANGTNLFTLLLWPFQKHVLVWQISHKTFCKTSAFLERKLPYHIWNINRHLYSCKGTSLHKSLLFFSVHNFFAFSLYQSQLAPL